MIAGHSCDGYDLLLTLVFDEQAEQSFQGFAGADLTNQGCSKNPPFESAIACEFRVKAGKKEKLGVLFVGEFSPVFYSSVWERSSSWQPPVLDWLN